MPSPILIVDDDSDLRLALTELLEEEGYAVEGAADGRGALVKLQAGLRPSLILLDLMMPGMNGWDFRTAQLEDPTLRALPVVVVTASGSDLATIQSQLGSVELVAKPIHPAELLDVVGRLARPVPLRNLA